MFKGVAALGMFLAAAATAGAQVRPPVIANAAPYGVQRGTTASVTVDGTNLGDADAVLFSDAGLSARIVSVADFGPDVPVRRPGDTGAPISKSRPQDRRYPRDHGLPGRAARPSGAPAAHPTGDVHGDPALGG